MKTRSSFRSVFLPVMIIFAFFLSCKTQPKVTPEEAEEIAEEAYIYAYPMIFNYKTMYLQAVEKNSESYRAPFNEFHHSRQLLDADFTEVVTPNNDTFYSFFWLDLSDEPIVISVPDMPDKRYFHFQLVDLFTHNFAYIGTRTTGTGEGHYLIAGPGWEGSAPEGITKVFRCESNYVFCPGRTQVNGEKDIPSVKARQDEYKITPLSTFLGESAPEARETPNFPGWDENRTETSGFIAYFNFLLGQLEIPESEKDLFERFAKIGIEPNKSFNVTQYDSKVLDAIERGVVRGLEKIKTQSKKAGERHNGWLLNYDSFGDREVIGDRYLDRAIAAFIGLYGNSVEEAFYPLTFVDAKGDPLDGAKNSYKIHFKKGDIPPVNAFWSISLYRLPERLFVSNPLKKYSIGDRTEGLKYGKDGSLTIYIQHKPPAKKLQPNWLPAPKGPFYLVMRLYWPKEEVLNKTWKPQGVVKK